MAASKKPTIDEIVDLKRRIAEAEFLLIYVTQAGIEKRKKLKDDEKEVIISRKDIENIVQAKRTYGTDDWSKEIETDFFTSLRTIAHVISPVSVDSIKTLNNKEYFSIVSFFNVIIGAILNLFIALLRKFKITIKGKAIKYFSLRAEPITFAKKLTREFALYTILIILVLLFFQIKFIIGTGLYKEYQEELGFCTVLQDSLKREAYIDVSQIDTVNVIYYDSLRNELLEHMNSKKWVGSMLNRWNSPWKYFLPSLFLEGEDIDVGISIGMKVDPDYMFRATKYVLNVFYSYLLPILYGLLGGVCLILRNLAKEIREHILTRDRDIRFYLRLILGGLSGLAIGWFFGVEEINDVLILKTISPFALAFIGGYGVDLLFSLLDGLLAKFTKSNAYSESNQ